MATTLARWRESFLAPMDTVLFPFVTPEIKIEQLVEEGEFIVRAELPGLDPDTDVTVSVEDGMLRIQAERTEEKREKAHSEFHYGRMVRTVTLPPGAREETTTARYAKGILEIRLTLGEPKPAGRQIEIEVVHEPETKPTPKPKK